MVLLVCARERETHARTYRDRGDRERARERGWISLFFPKYW